MRWKPVKDRLLEGFNVIGLCWVWKKSKNNRGYGTIYTEGKGKLAHRVSYEVYKGRIPEGLQLDHLCRNRACINPEHLEPVTNKENARRGMCGKYPTNGEYGKSKTHCPREHEYSTINTYVDPKGRRKCKPCRKIRGN